jgi:hypothetical protein
LRFTFTLVGCCCSGWLRSGWLVGLRFTLRLRLRYVGWLRLYTFGWFIYVWFTVLHVTVGCYVYILLVTLLIRWLFPVVRLVGSGSFVVTVGYGCLRCG